MWRYIGGFVTLWVTDARPERFLRLCLRCGVGVRGVRRQEDGLRLSVRAGACGRLLTHAERLGIEVEVLRRQGLPFLLQRLSVRPVLAFGLPLCLLALSAASLFLWDVRVVGAEGAQARRVLEALRERGVHVGTYAEGVDAESLQNELLVALPELKWIAVNIRGSRARVHLRLRDEGPEPLPAAPADLVAERDGLITALAVFSGTAAVQVGDTVAAGDVLVYGYETDVSGVRTPVRAEAWTRARSWLSLRAQTDACVRRVHYTGERRQTLWMVFGKKLQKIWPWSRIYPSEYDTITVRESASLSLGLLREVDRTYTTVLCPYEQAGQVLYAALRARAESIGGEVCSESFSLTEGESAVTARYECECMGPIGTALEKDG